jgi:hypothetical protein
MEDRRPGKLPGGTLQAIDHGFVRQENLGLVRIERAVPFMRPPSGFARHLISRFFTAAYRLRMSRGSRRPPTE